MILVDGREADAVPVDDRGLAYGDGMFETLCVHRGCLPLMNYHLERLFTGLHTLDFPQISRQVLIDELEHAARRSGDDIVKLIVTRGSGGRGYAPPENTEPRRIIVTGAASASLAEWRRAGVVLRHCATVLNGPQRLAGLKHLNRLPQVLARAEWRDAGQSLSPSGRIGGAAVWARADFARFGGAPGSDSDDRIRHRARAAADCGRRQPAWPRN